MIVAHHGFGEEVIIASLAAGGSGAVASLVVLARVKLDAIRRWLLRR